MNGAGDGKGVAESREAGRGARQAAAEAGQDRACRGLLRSPTPAAPKCTERQAKRQVREERTKDQAAGHEAGGGRQFGKPSERAQHRNTNPEAASLRRSTRYRYRGEEGGGGPPRARKAVSVSPGAAPLARGPWFPAPSACGRPAPRLARAARPRQAGAPAPRAAGGRRDSA